MANSYSRLLDIRRKEPITQETHPEFWHQLQAALLLGLLERGSLSAVAYHHASEALGRQRRGKALTERDSAG